MSNKVINLNKIRAASDATRPDRAVMLFDYYAPESESGQTEQRPLVRVVHNSLTKLKDGDWIFRGISLLRVNEKTRNLGIRSYRLSRINGIVSRLSF